MSKVEDDALFAEIIKTMDVKKGEFYPYSTYYGENYILKFQVSKGLALRLCKDNGSSRIMYTYMFEGFFTHWNSTWEVVPSPFVDKVATMMDTKLLEYVEKKKALADSEKRLAEKKAKEFVSSLRRERPAKKRKVESFDY